MEKWKAAIREAQTFSRMHVLLGMLDACIKWDMSAENARCKVCRKKGEYPNPISCLVVGSSAVSAYAEGQRFNHQVLQLTVL